jgi:FMN phosphatase YigB (HAD superfamily)
MKAIMWDVDDVLNDLMGEWFRSRWIPLHPQCPVDYLGINVNPPHELLGVDKREYLESLDAFRNDSFRYLKPIPEMLEWFRQHGRKAEHIVVTSVPLIAAHHSADWVFSHFGEWVRSFNIVPSTREGSRDHGTTSKSDYIRTFSKVDIVVEDNPETIRSMREMGISTVTIPRPWNDSRETLESTLTGLANLIAD